MWLFCCRACASSPVSEIRKDFLWPCLLLLVCPESHPPSGRWVFFATKLSAKVEVTSVRQQSSSSYLFGCPSFVVMSPPVAGSGGGQRRISTTTVRYGTAYARGLSQGSWLLPCIINATTGYFPFGNVTVGVHNEQFSSTSLTGCQWPSCDVHESS